MREWANTHEERILNRVLNNGKKNYTGYATKRSFYYGTLAELTFVFLLREMGKRADYMPPADVADNVDVTVYLKDFPVNINVKCATQPNHKLIICYPKQLERYGYRDESYVAIRLEGDYARIMGYFYKKDLRQVDIQGDSRLGVLLEPDMRYPDLNVIRPLDQMLEKIIEGETKIVLPY